VKEAQQMREIDKLEAYIEKRLHRRFLLFPKEKKVDVAASWPSC